MGSDETFQSYLAPDRRRAILDGVELAMKSEGAALWADLSGFTSLSETLARKLGVRRGAEELGLHLNRFYDRLIAPVELYGGSVVSFSGDAITCWFAEDDGRRAIAAAQGLHAAMETSADLKLSTGESIRLGIKTAVVSGPVWRYRVGDPAVQYLDTLAGATLDRLAGVGRLVETGELLVDESTAEWLKPIVRVTEWRIHPETGVRAGVLAGLEADVEPAAATLRNAVVSEAQIRPWLLRPVYARLQNGDGEFLTELRPAVALFMRFDGLEYENDEQAGQKLDGIIRRVQGILDAYDGTLLQLTIGDKGSYVYAAFGAPVAHEDDAERAVEAALELRRLPVASVSIGLSRGVMRTGAYGGTTRRTYGVLGDEVNLAARLMERAAAGQVLASESIWQATGAGFNWQKLATLKVKGRRAVVKPAVLLGREVQETGLHRPALPMVGRKPELALVKEKLELARQGQGQIVSITAEAGMGKSRLLAEVLERTDEMLIYLGECQSYGTHSSYLVWRSIWRGFFEIDPAASVNRQIETLEKALAEIDPGLLPRLPLLGAVLNLNIAENDLTNGLDARARKNSREALLSDCLRAKAAEHPLVLMLEDVHWIDPLSRDLLELIGRVIKELPVLVLLAYRPEAKTLLPHLGTLEYASEVRLVELTRDETEEMIAARLGYFKLDGVVTRLQARAQGNPFYIEELLNYMRDRGLDPREESAWEPGALPDSLQSLILSRIDQLSEQQQITLKAASIIGRLFRVIWLSEYYPPLGGSQRVSAELEVLSRLELIAEETPAPQLAYLFKHVITQEVAYESLAYATRAGLHEQFARYLELLAGPDVRPYLDLLAYHYERSDNLAKKREYLRRAGEAAQAAYANEAALSYLGRALALAPEADYAGRFAILAVREQVLNILGKREAQSQDLTALTALAEALDDNERRAQAAVNRAKYARAINDYPAAIAAAQLAVELGRLAGANEHEARGYWLWGEALFFQGFYAEARTRYEQALALAQTAGLTNLTANILMGFGILDTTTSEYDSAQKYLEQALQLQRQGGDRIGENLVLSSLGDSAFLRGDFVNAQAYYEQTLQSWRSIGYKQSEGRTLSRLASLIIQQASDFDKAKLYSEQALPLSQEAGDRTGEMVAFYNLSDIDLTRNNYQLARTQAEKALGICREISYRYYEGGCLTQLGTIADELGEYARALEDHNQGVAVLREIGERDLMCQILTASAIVYYHLGRLDQAVEANRQALAIVGETKNDLVQTRVSTLQGHVLRNLGDLEQAAAAYHQALELSLKLGMPQYANQAQTGLACLALAKGKPAAAQVYMDGILSYLATDTSGTRDEIIWIYLSCYRILDANADPRARATLQAGYSLLQQIAARIDNDDLKASFLQNVRFNRELAQTWGRQAPA